jgi:hypothetical protein
VIVAALDDKVGLTPSNSQIAKHIHGGLHNSLKEGVSYTFTDAQRSFLVNIEYHYPKPRHPLFWERYLSKEDAK